MFLNNAIHKYLNNIADSSVIKKGSDLMKFEFVQNILHNAKERYYSANVKNVHTIKIFYQNAFQISNVSCNCMGKIPCEHLVGTMYQLLAMKDEDIKTFKEASKSKTDTKIIDFKSYAPVQPNVKGLLEFQSPNEFRKFPFENAKTLVSGLQTLKPKHPRNFGYGTDYSNELLETGELDFLILKKQFNYYWNEAGNSITEEARVSFKIKNEQLYIKCNQCRTKTNLLCDHQYAILSISEYQVLVFNPIWRNYDNLVKLLAGEHKISDEKFNALYNVYFVYDKPRARLTKANFLDYNILKGLTAELRNTKSGENSDLAEMLTRISGKTIEVKKNAFLWVLEDSDRPVLPQILEGVVSKTNDKLTSRISLEDKPLFFNEEENELYNLLLDVEKKFVSGANHRYFTYMINALKQNIDVLQKSIHYYTFDFEKQIKIKKKDLYIFTFSDQYVTLDVDVNEDKLFYKVVLRLKIGERIIDQSKEPILIHDTFMVLGEKAYLYEDISVLHYYLTLGTSELLTDKDYPEPLVELLHELNQKFDVKYPEKYLPIIGELSTPVREIYLKEAGDYVLFQPKLAYDESFRIAVPNDDRYVSEVDAKGNFIIYEPEPEEISGLCNFLVESHPSLKESFEVYDSFYLHTHEMIKNAWFLEFFEKCRSEGIVVYGQETLKNFRFNSNPANISLGMTSGIDWFDVNVEVSFGTQKAGLKDWVESIKNNEKFIRLDDGSLGLIPDDWFEKLKQVVMLAEEEKGKLKMSKFRLGAIDLLFQEISDDDLKEEISKKLKQLNDYEFKKEYKLPVALTAEPREYQILGFQWLKALSDLGFGGCLADDMGLGKTLQIISLLADQKELKKGTSLAVVPRSLLFNWAAEIDKFCPSLTYLNYHGTDRVLKREELFNYDLVITTYDTATNDIEFFKSQKFNYIILDESQAIKNPNSKRYKAMRLLKANNRMVMTGTPIENNTFDLYAQFSFLNPGIFGSQQNFKNNFAIPIDKNNDADAAMMLRKIINPFLLRRTKEQVAKDLPERTENIIYCDMGKAQRDYYDALKIRIREDLENNIKKQGFNKAKFKIIEGLLRLRQVCNAPQLVDPTLHRHASVKIETLMDIVINDLGNHNALVFSQFTSMLDLIRKELDRNNIPYAYLDGSTKDRKAAVENFENNDNIRLFLISLKAGNTGLNLIKADYVYLIDPWWNPAVEAQAIDRTHRIGQVKNIFAYRMICKNTIEEKIIELQSKKKKLASDLVVTDENVFKSLEKEDLMDLFV